MTTVEFINQGEWGIETEGFGVLIDRLHQAIRCMQGILNVVFVNDVYIQALNKAYRKKDKPTDVLSFNYDPDPSDSESLIGEIYISVETARRQAGEHKRTLIEELQILFVHGFLHIHGYDHEEDEDYKKMHEIECQVIQRKLPFII